MMLAVMITNTLFEFNDLRERGIPGVILKRALSNNFVIWQEDHQ